MPKKNVYVPTKLKENAKLYAERNKQYGDSYKQHGKIMQELFPLGITIKTELDHARFGILTMIVAKINRYANNFNNGGHIDSLDDISVYAMMLQELDENGV